MASKDIVYVNGSFVPRAEARVSVDDRGFVFGDGVYEVLRAITGRLFATRFQNELNRGEATLYIQITRGATTRSHFFPPPEIEPTIYISVAAFTPYADLAR